MRNQNQIELLAPAGSIAGLKGVIAAGADAVYIGATRFGARAYAQNPEEKELLEAIDYAHLHGVKVYLTVNTLMKESELSELAGFLRPYHDQGIDAVLVQDFGALRVIRREFPHLPIHASTQMTVTGWESARLLKEAGVERVVAARELSLSEIRSIPAKAGIGVEVFVHGALCYCYSGQCLFSSMIGGRSGNRGRCAQPCRLPYTFQNRKGTLLNTKDLCAVCRLRELKEAGVCSLKIEGRMKQPEYAAGVTSIYRKYLDILEDDPLKDPVVSEEDLSVLHKLYQREGFTDGYFSRRNGPEMMSLAETGSGKKIAEDGSALYKMLREKYLLPEDPVPVKGELTLKEGEPAVFNVSGNGILVHGEGDSPQKAASRPMTEEDFRRPLLQTGGSGFAFTEISVKKEGDLFLPNRSLKELRRDTLEVYRDACCSSFRRSNIPAKPSTDNSPPERIINIRMADTRETGPVSPSDLPAFSASFLTKEQGDVLLRDPYIKRVYLPYHLVLQSGTAYASQFLSACRQSGKNCFIALPHVRREKYGNQPEELKQTERNADGVLVRSLEDLARLNGTFYEKNIITDAGLYSWNGEAVRFLTDQGADEVTIPAELNRHELQNRVQGIMRADADIRQELPVYGREALMISAQCLFRNTGGCRKRSEGDYLTDRTGPRFYVKSFCDFCYNVIYNSVPLNLSGSIGSLRLPGVASYRLAFTDESPEEVSRILSDFRQALESGQPVPPSGPFTKGHLERGVL